MNNTRNVECVVIWVPVYSDIFLPRARESDVYDEGVFGVEDVNGGCEGVAFVGAVDVAILLGLVAEVLEERVVHEASHHGGEVE